MAEDKMREADTYIHLAQCGDNSAFFVIAPDLAAASKVAADTGKAVKKDVIGVRRITEAGNGYGVYMQPDVPAPMQGGPQGGPQIVRVPPGAKVN